MIQVNCPNCGRQIRFENAAAGRQGTCPCGATVQVPQSAGLIDQDPTFMDDILGDSPSFMDAVFFGFFQSLFDSLWPTRSRSKASPPRSSQAAVPSAASPAKSRVTAGLLAVFLGTMGIHNFYLGRTSIAVWQLLLAVFGGVVTCGVATIIVLVWALIEAILIFAGAIRDGSGRPLSA